MKLSEILRFLALSGVIVTVVACSSSSPDITDPPQKQAAAILNQGGVYKVGNPYKILGRWYYPKEDYNYKEEGTASWYGPDFHAKRTANGEKYDMNALTAAHRTLPLPSIVRVTNLENGRSLVVRVNDRGPYARNRVIDVSKKVAQLLGFLEQGTAKVRVEVLEKESKNLKAALTGSPLYEDISAAPVTKIEASRMAPLEGAAVAASYDKLSPNYNYEPSDNSDVPALTQDEVVGEGGFFVQAGAFTDVDAAESLKKRLSSFGPSSVSVAKVNGQMFYRVRVGPYSGQNQAVDMLSRIRDFGIQTAHIVEN